VRSTACSRAYVDQQLVPVLKPGGIVIMDNLGSHESAARRRMIKAAGTRLLYLPPYSPDLNPIEQPASVDPSECSNYFANGGYASVKM
jgi:putative transposase